jgi:hypothetical protein
MLIAIVGPGGKILGWTSKVPEVQGMILRHAEAERLLGGGLSCTYVQIDDRDDATRAGAPPEWNGPWRCIAICSDGADLGAKRSDRRRGAASGAAVNPARRLDGQQELPHGRRHGRNEELR